MLIEEYYFISCGFDIIMSQKMLEASLCVGGIIKTAFIKNMVGRRCKFLIDSPSKFRLLGSEILFLEVPNQSRPKIDQETEK